ncbi:MAG: hypothetical protein EP330_14535 [Deltaproteobacteria bacterium]|nr:MAG: hypothetical protein EP330_14535 [Deltaproteobacteria bacterium]
MKRAVTGTAVIVLLAAGLLVPGWLARRDLAVANRSLAPILAGTLPPAPTESAPDAVPPAYGGCRGTTRGPGVLLACDSRALAPEHRLLARRADTPEEVAWIGWLCRDEVSLTRKDGGQVAVERLRLLAYGWPDGEPLVSGTVAALPEDLAAPTTTGVAQAAAWVSECVD